MKTIRNDKEGFYFLVPKGVAKEFRSVAGSRKLSRILNKLVVEYLKTQKNPATQKRDGVDDALLDRYGL